MPDLQLLEDIEQLCARIDASGREWWWVHPAVNTAFEGSGYHLVPRLFYSPVPDPVTVESYQPDKEFFPLENCTFNLEGSVALISELTRYSNELADVPETLPPDQPGFCWQNDLFSSSDALTLYGLIRRVRPRQIVEIGSGYSSHLALRALRENGVGSLHCIEPYPSSKLLQIAGQIQLTELKVQEVPIETFQGLEKDDILIIDSSHVMALGSDVNYEFLSIIPRLASGVLIHVHDIFIPFEYPKEWTVRRRWYWNEQYALYALLLMNAELEILIPSQYMFNKRLEVMEALLAPAGRSGAQGSSFWMRRR